MLFNQIMNQKKLNFRNLMLLGTFLIVSGCGSSEDYTYQYNENGCETGKHEFDSKESYCNGLKNEDINHGCASSIREKTYKSNCT